MCDVVRAQGDRIAKLEDIDACYHQLVTVATEQTNRIAKLEAWREQISAAAKTKPSGASSAVQVEGSERVCPASIATPAAAGPITPGYALAPGWTVYSPGRFDCGRCGAAVVTGGGNMAFAGPGEDWYVCRVCAGELGAIVKAEPPAEQPAGAADGKRQPCPRCDGIGTACNCGVPCGKAECATKPPAPSHGAPAEPLSADCPPGTPLSDRIEVSLRGLAPDAHRDQIRADVAALEARLAAAERERDEALVSVKQAVARWQKFHDEEKERWRAGLQRANEAAENRVANVISDCLRIVEEYEPRRDVPADWSYQGALSRVADAIRDGRPVPK